MLMQSHYKVGCDAHKHYSLFSIFDGQGRVVRRTRVDHQRGAIQNFLSQFPPGTPVALETVGNWYWIVDEIEGAGCTPLLAHALLAKKRMGYVHKTDKLDADGLATLLHMGTLPAVWIPPGDLRDERELPRTRMAFSKVRTMLKNRIHSTLAKYALSLDTDSDIFTAKWRPQLLAVLQQLPAETRRCVDQELELLELLQAHIHRLEERILKRVEITPTIRRVMSIPGPAEILSIVIDRELGSIDRFPSPKHLASYCGLVPRVSASGGKVHYGRMVQQCNHYLKWAFIEAANVVVRQRHHSNWSGKYVVRLFERTRQRKGHAVAVGATARYLTEATFWVLKKGEPYREPVPRRPVGSLLRTSPKQGQARA
ncbi:MAG TPA: IS110 family transposase [Anaerolineales bacterium]|nr:IS110 family transposase [Anaerolineales bacterium]